MTNQRLTLNKNLHSVGNEENVATYISQTLIKNVFETIRALSSDVKIFLQIYIYTYIYDKISSLLRTKVNFRGYVLLIFLETNCKQHIVGYFQQSFRYFVHFRIEIKR